MPESFPDVYDLSRKFSKNISPFLQPLFSQTEFSRKRHVICILKLWFQIVLYNLLGLSAMITSHHLYHHHFIHYSREIEHIRLPQNRHVTKM